MELSEAAKEKRREYARRYYKRFPEKRKKWTHDYWERKAKKECETTIWKNEQDREAMYWIASMCISNSGKTHDKSLFPVREFITLCRFCGLNEKYAKSIYDYINENNHYEFKRGHDVLCYVSGSPKDEWFEDSFVIPVLTYTEDEFWAFKSACDISENHA